MKLIIDLQACQSASRYRGIGRYSADLTRAILRLAQDEHQVFLMLTDLLPDERDAAIDEFGSFVAAEYIMCFSALGPVRELEPQNAGRRLASELLREHAILSIQPDVLHVSSLFEGLGDDVVTSIDLPTLARKTAVTWYDMIPFVQPDTYLQIPGSKEHYYRKIESAKRAQRLFAISQYTADEAIELLGIEAEKVVNIRGGVDPKFCVDRSKRSQLRPLGIEREFVLYTSSFDHRKNQGGLIEAFAKLPAQLREQHQLVLVGEIWDAKRTELEALAKGHGLNPRDVVLTGQVDEAKLLAIYQSARLFVFPSFHEGLGLPALESMSCGVPAIGSNCTGLPEVIGRTDALFDPSDIGSMSRKMAQVLANEHFHAELTEHGRTHVKKYRWENSAAIVLEHYSQICRDAQSPIGLRAAPKQARTQSHKSLVDSIATVAIQHDFDPAELTAIARSIEKNEAMCLSS